MFRELKITFDALERFQGKVVIDAGQPLTVIVGPNGSGKSTILEAAAEVMIFLCRHPLEGALEQIRKDLRTQRPTFPKWERAMVELELGTPVIIGESMEKLLGQFGGSGKIVFNVIKRMSQRLVVESIICDGKELAFDIKGDIFVDSIGMRDAERQLKDLEQALLTRINEAKKEFTRQKGAGAETSALHEIRQKIAEAEAAVASDESNAWRDRLKKEIQEGKNSAVPLTGGGQVLKSDITAFHESMEWPEVIFLQGWPDISLRIKAMTKLLGDLKAKPRSERPHSQYLDMRDRLHDLLKMDVAIDSKDNHLLLIEDRPVEEVSLGTWLALGFAAICETTDNDTLVVWDEPETGLHPTWVRKIGDLMRRGRRRFLIATHRTEFVPIGESTTRVYKTLARPETPGQKAICSVHEASGLLHGFSIASALGIEPSRVLFTANAVIWVEGPSDVVYWRFWLGAAAQARGIQFVEGFDYCFMFSSGTLLANETFGSKNLPSDAVDLLRLVGASLVIVDTDFNPDDESRRISREQLLGLQSACMWGPRGFVLPPCHQFLKPRVKALLSTLADLREADNMSTVVSTWGREAENGLTDATFRRVLRRIYDVTDSDAEAAIIDRVSVEDWRSYGDEIKSALEKHISDPSLAKLWTQRNGNKIVAQMSIVNDKVEFARHYVESSRDLGLGSVRKELKEIIEEVFSWVVRVKESYGQ